MGKFADTNTMENQLFLSIVIIARNEEDNIQRCISSVLQFSNDIPSKEVILIDSASGDKTIEIAKKFPIQIFQLQPNLLSPAAGRSLGISLAKGEFIFFMDGDMELKPGWLQAALSRISQDERMAGIAGRVNDIYANSNKIVKEVKDRTHVGNQEGMAHTFGGCALYRSAVLREVGGFNPNIRTKEELELALRIRNKGYYLWNVPFEMVDHHTYNPGSFTEIKTIIKLNQYAGIGQVFRIAYENKYFWRCARENSYVFHFYMYLIFSGILLALGYVHVINHFVWLAVTLCYLPLLAIKKRSLGQALTSSVAKLCYGVSFFRDFFKKPKQPGQQQFDFIKIH